MDKIDIGQEEKEWEDLLKQLPASLDLEKTAFDSGALIRKRKVKSANDLLRLIFGYSLCKLSLRSTAGWAASIKIADISDVGLLGRLKNSRIWLKDIVSAILRERCDQKHDLDTDYGVNFVDATYVKTQGTKGDNYCIHSRFHLGGGQFGDFKVDDTTGRETFNHFTWEAGAIAVGDRAYAKAIQLLKLVKNGADFIVRVGLTSMSLQNLDGSTFSLMEAVRDVDEGITASHDIQVAVKKGRKIHDTIKGRLLIAKLGKKTQARSQKIAKRSGQKRQTTPAPETLEMANYLVLFTSLSEEVMPSSTIFTLYRLRWQIEIAFKRLKSLLQLDELKAQNDQLVQVCLYASLILSLITEQITDQVIEQIKTASPELESSKREISVWRIFALIVPQLTNAILGPFNLENFLENVSLLYRNLCEPPRKRKLLNSLESFST